MPDGTSSNDTVVFKRLLKGSLTASQYYTKLSEIYDESISNQGNLYLIESWSGKLVWFARGKCLSDYVFVYDTGSIYPSDYESSVHELDHVVISDDPFMSLMLHNSCFDHLTVYIPNVVTSYTLYNTVSQASSITWDLFRYNDSPNDIILYHRDDSSDDILDDNYTVSDPDFSCFVDLPNLISVDGVNQSEESIQVEITIDPSDQFVNVYSSNYVDCIFDLGWYESSTIEVSSEDFSCTYDGSQWIVTTPGLPPGETFSFGGSIIAVYMTDLIHYVYRGLSTGNKGLVCSLEVEYPASGDVNESGFYPFKLLAWKNAGDEVV